MYRSWIVKLTSRARFSTVCLHAGQEPDPATGAIVTPIYQTSTYVQDELGKHKGYEYGRTHNPTRLAVERNLAAIEGGRAAYAFASGMAAIGAIATMLRAGDHVIVSDNVYGGTFRLFDKVLSRYQLSFTYVDTSDSIGSSRPSRRIRGCSSSRHRPIRSCRSRTCARRPTSPIDTTCASWSTTRSRARTTSVPSNAAPTW